MNPLIYLLVALFYLIETSDSFNFKKHLSTKGLYPIVSNKATPINAPESCELVHLHLVSRHGVNLLHFTAPNGRENTDNFMLFTGARYPSANDNERFDVLDELFANITLAKKWVKIQLLLGSIT